MKKTYLISALLLYFISFNLQAQNKLYPVIKGYGAIEPVPFETVKPDPNQEYKLINELYFQQQDKAEFYDRLDYAARIVNAHAAAGVPKENFKMAIVIFSSATFISLSNEEYNKRFNVDNPNIEVIDKLIESGVEVIVCGQSMVKQNIKPEQVHEGITLSFSRITATSELISKGYSVF